MIRLLQAVFVLVLFSDHAQVSLALVLERAGAHAVEYENKFSLLVAEERYEQIQTTQMTAAGGGAMITLSPGGVMTREQRRTLVSAYPRSRSGNLAFSPSATEARRLGDNSFQTPVPLSSIGIFRNELRVSVPPWPVTARSA